MLTYAMHSVVGDSESSDDDDGEHDASLTTAMTSMSLDRSAKTFVASFHRWMTSVDSGLSQASADMYARHAARFVEALGGTVGGLARYVELPGRAPQDAQADVREGGAVGTQEGVCVRQARVDDGTVCGRFLSARRREDRQLDGQPEGGRGEATTPAQGGRGRRRAEADRVAARVRRPVHV